MFTPVFNLLPNILLHMLKVSFFGYNLHFDSFLSKTKLSRAPRIIRSKGPGKRPCQFNTMCNNDNDNGLIPIKGPRRAKKKIKGDHSPYNDYI